MYCIIVVQVQQVYYINIINLTACPDGFRGYAIMAQGTFTLSTDKEVLKKSAQNQKIKLRSQIYKFADGKLQWGINKTEIRGAMREIPEVVLEDPNGVKINVPMKYFGTRTYLNHKADVQLCDIEGLSPHDDNYSICIDLEGLNATEARFKVKTQTYIAEYDGNTYPSFVQALVLAD